MTSSQRPNVWSRIYRAVAGWTSSPEATFYNALLQLRESRFTVAPTETPEEQSRYLEHVLREASSLSTPLARCFCGLYGLPSGKTRLGHSSVECHARVLGTVISLPHSS